MIKSLYKSKENLIFAEELFKQVLEQHDNIYNRQR